MNETMSLLLATAILAAGGIGLFMLKTDDDKYIDNDNEELMEEIDFDDLDELDDYEDYKPKSRKNKTKRNTKQTGGSRRRY
jgi:tRNA G46 methylase TrmB